MRCKRDDNLKIQWLLRLLPIASYYCNAIIFFISVCDLVLLIKSLTVQLNKIVLVYLANPISSHFC